MIPAMNLLDAEVRAVDGGFEPPFGFVPAIGFVSAIGFVPAISFAPVMIRPYFRSCFCPNYRLNRRRSHPPGR